ncbi:hypothetical protein ACFVWN_01245 [Nocardiopsis flavescens]|uniref:hypothetical protein n=1 Tax=Nocardiopsis flavescens TaxID=758803 RepID=UPI00365E7B76
MSALPAPVPFELDYACDLILAWVEVLPDSGHYGLDRTMLPEAVSRVRRQFADPNAEDIAGWEAAFKRGFVSAFLCKGAIRAGEVGRDDLVHAMHMLLGFLDHLSEINDIGSAVEGS